MKIFTDCTQSWCSRSCSRRPRLRGDIHTGSPTPIPPNQPSVTESIQSALAMENPQGTCESVAGVALSLVQTILSVF